MSWISKECSGSENMSPAPPPDRGKYVVNPQHYLCEDPLDCDCPCHDEHDD